MQVPQTAGMESVSVQQAEQGQALTIVCISHVVRNMCCSGMEHV